MKMRKNRNGKFFASILVIAMVMSLACSLLIINAGAIAPGYTVSNHGVVNHSSLPDPDDMDYGQVATAKSVSNSTTTNFGDGINGQFSVFLSAIARSYEGEQLITDTGITFRDTFEDEYAFVASATEMKIYVDGAEKTALFDSVEGKYVYSEYFFGGSDAASRIQAIFDPVANTVVYIIGERCVQNITGYESTTEMPSSLEFGVRLKDSVAAAGTYNTNLPDSCTAEFNALESNWYYHQDEESSLFSNADREQVEVWGAGWFDDPWHIDDFGKIRLSLEDPFSDDQYYQFDEPYLVSGHIGIEYTPGTTSDVNDYYYDLWILPGIYTNLHTDEPYKSHIVEILPTFCSFSVHFDIPALQSTNIGNHGYINVLTPKPVPVFTVNTAPAGMGGACSVTVGETTYTGACTEWTSGTNWSFISEEGYTITLLNEYDLEVVYQEEGWINNCVESLVSHTHNAYGFVTLTFPYDPPETPTPSQSDSPSPSPSISPSPSEPPSPSTSILGDADASVAGDSDVLPQTGGISNSTLIGIFGLALISIGGTTFMIFRKKFLNK